MRLTARTLVPGHMFHFWKIFGKTPYNGTVTDSIVLSLLTQVSSGKETVPMKKLVLLAMVAFAFLASARTARIDIPLPTCNPCPYVQ